MDATIVPEVQKHYPVLLKEIISIISPQYGGIFIDCTFGQGGYSKKILEYPNTNVIGITNMFLHEWEFIYQIVKLIKK